MSSVNVVVDIDRIIEHLERIEKKLDLIRLDQVAHTSVAVAPLPAPSWPSFWPPYQPSVPVPTGQPISPQIMCENQNVYDDGHITKCETWVPLPDSNVCEGSTDFDGRTIVSRGVAHNE